MASTVHFIDPPGFYRAGPTIGAKYGIALLKQKLREVSAVLPGNARYDCTVSVVRHGGVSFIVSLQKGRALLVRCVAGLSLSQALGAQHRVTAARV